MKVIIAGSRGCSVGAALLERVLAFSGFPVTEVVSGCCSGPDSDGSRWAHQKGIPVKEFPARWEIGRHAGLKRNKEMAEYADRLIAFWDGRSRGTKHMIEMIARLGKPYCLYFSRQRVFASAKTRAINAVFPDIP